MKKIYTLLLLFTITLFYSIPTQAYTLNDLDVEIAELNDLTLREVFIDNNLDYTASHSMSDLYYKTDDNISSINNYYYAAGKNLRSSDISFWEQGTINTTGGNGISVNAIRTIGFLPVLSDTNYTYSVASGYRSLAFAEYDINFNFIIRYTNSTQILTITTDINTAYIRIAFGKEPVAPTTTSDLILGDILLEESATATTFESYIPPTTLINLTDLGLTTVSLTRMNYYYNQFQRISAYIEGYDEGFDVGYNEGYDDGVASDTSYAVGYALGLSEGEDMETGSSLLILIVALIGFVMMIFGFTTKRGIFNLLSVGAFVVLGTLLVEFVGFIIIAIGLVIINIYYAFFGDV
jgi:hypothetical protein